MPGDEERETRLKATGFFRIAARARRFRAGAWRRVAELPAGVRLLLVDNDDCFIQTIANYVRQTGAEVMTYRSGFPLSLIDDCARSF
jgi:anthranilate synthase